MKREEEYLISSLLFAIGAIIWITTVPKTYHQGGVVKTIKR